MPIGSPMCECWTVPQHVPWTGSSRAAGREVDLYAATASFWACGRSWGVSDRQQHELHPRRITVQRHASRSRTALWHRFNVLVATARWYACERLGSSSEYCGRAQVSLAPSNGSAYSGSAR